VPSIITLAPIIGSPEEPVTAPEIEPVVPAGEAAQIEKSAAAQRRPAAG